MAERKRNKEIHFYVTEEERKLIRRKMIESKSKNMGAYLRKMAIDGYIVNTDTSFNAFMPHEISKKRYIITTFQHRTVSYSIRAFTCFRNCLHCILYICIIFTLERILSLVEGYFEKMIWSDCSPTKMQLFFSSFQRF